MDMSKQPTKLAIFSWCFYDFAGSAFPTLITTFIFATYFTESIAANPIAGTTQWGYAMAVSGLFIAILSPLFGAISDNEGRRKPWLGLFTALVIVCSSLLWFSKPSAAYVTWTLTLVIIATTLYEVGLVFYNSMLDDLAPKAYLGRISGWAWSIGYFGGLACLVTALFGFITPTHPLLSLDKTTAEHIRIVGPLVALWYFIFSLPLFIFTPDHPSTGLGLKQSMLQGLHTLMQTLKKLHHYKNVVLFLIAHLIYIDGLNTIFAFGGIYAAGSFGMRTEQIIQFGLTMNVAAGVGAGAFAWVDDYIGSKKTVLISLVGMVIFGIMILSVHSQVAFWLLAMGLCLFVGPTQAASRSLLIRIAPKHLMTEMFGLYALSGRVTAFMGPWLLAMTTAHFNSQRAGMTVPIIFLFLGCIVLMFVKLIKIQDEAQ